MQKMINMIAVASQKPTVGDVAGNLAAKKWLSSHLFKPDALVGFRLMGGSADIFTFYRHHVAMS